MLFLHENRQLLIRRGIEAPGCCLVVDNLFIAMFISPDKAVFSTEKYSFFFIMSLQNVMGIN